jgi:hypothetical protein
MLAILNEPSSDISYRPKHDIWASAGQKRGLRATIPSRSAIIYNQLHEATFSRMA